ncbi:MAG: T9SS type A sorting domain-containing protein [Ignavibacteria bacterium]|nr:T9SS type A sorting domain-containing protein [Ignavibacteria bacterium]
MCDLNGNVYVSGFTLSASFLNTDIISIKYDSSGNEIWQRRFDNKGDDYIRPLMSRVDANNNLIVASYYKTDSTYIDYLTYKYDSDGDLLWHKIYDGGVQNTDWINDMTIDRDNNVIITGSSRGMGTSYDFFTIKYSPSSSELWQSRINDSTNTSDEGTTIALDSKQNVFVFGTVNSEYSLVCFYNNSGSLLSTFRNFSMKNAASINIDKNDYPVLVGLRDPKTITAKYLNIVSEIKSANSESVQTNSILQQNYPNPFNPKTIINYTVPLILKGQMLKAKLIVYNSLGKEVYVLLNEIKSAGNYEIVFDGSNLPNGIYFYSLFVNNTLIETKRMILLK